MEHLTVIEQLQTLVLSDTPVMDAGLKELAKLKHLRKLELHRTKVTDIGFAQLKSLRWNSSMVNGTPQR
jgi:hypothetical protein